MPFLYGFKPKYWKQSDSIVLASASERCFSSKLRSGRLAGKAYFLNKISFKKTGFGSLEACIFCSHLSWLLPGVI